MMPGKNRILVVDDEKNLRLSLTLILQKEGYEVESASNADEALERLSARTWDLVFLDLNMPGRSGIDLLADIHSKYPDLAVLILTAHGTLETAIQAMRLGTSDYLIKPAEPQAILARVAEVLSEKNRPARKQEIVGEIQNLLVELQKMEGVSLGVAASTIRAEVDPARYINHGPFVVDTIARHVTMHEKYIPITGVYFDYFLVLLKHSPKSVSFRDLVLEAQGFGAPLPEAKDLTRWRIHELRKLIETDPQKPQYLLSVRGAGYRLAL
jgi:DNA-binding response OmpR family regulator